MLVLQRGAEKTKVKVSPSATLRQVLDSYCVDKGLEAPRFGLTHKGRALDLSLAFRLTGLKNNSVLEVAAGHAPLEGALVKVALQSAETGRLVHSVPVTSSLWALLAYWEARGKHNFTQLLAVDASVKKKKIGKDKRPLVYHQPVVTVLNRQFATIADLKTTTFASLGLKGGNCVANLSFKATELEAVPAEALDVGDLEVVLANEPVVEAKGEEEKVVAVEPVEEEPAAEAIVKEKAEEEKEPVEEEDDGATTCARNAHVYKPTDRQVHPDSIEVPDDFFRVSAADLALLKVKAGKPEDRPLMTRAIREERALSAFQFRKTKLRVRFPDRWEIEGTFLSSEATGQLEEFVKEYLVDPEAPFELYTAPPKQNLESTSFLKQRMTPAALVYFAWKDKERKAPYLSKAAQGSGIERPLPKALEGSSSKPPEKKKPKSSKGAGALGFIFGKKK